MIQLTGSLNIQTINGRNGDFNVGTLKTDIGEFAVKDSALDQYSEGSYEGSFIITQIKLENFSWGDRRHVIGLMAVVSHYHIDGIDDLPDELSPVGEDDPTDIDQSNNTAPMGTDESADIDASNLDDETLFGTEILIAIQEGKPIQLDPTVGRPKFPNQINRLKEHGYIFDANSKTWYRK